MNSIISKAARHPVFSNLLMALLLIGGWVAATTLNKEKFPEISLDTITVKTTFPGAAPEDVEEGITIKIEESIDGIAGVKQVRSESRENVSVIYITLEQGQNIRRIISDIEGQIDTITSFPDDAEEPVIQEMIREDSVINLALYGNATERTLRTIARDIRDELSANSEISKVNWFGVRDFEIAIELSESALQQWELTFEEVVSALRQGANDMPGGLLRGQNEEIQLRTRGTLYTGEEYEKLVIRADENGSTLRLKDIATVIDGFKETDILGRYNGKPAVLLTVLKTNDKDAIRISDFVHKYAKTKGENLPKGLSLATWRDDATLIRGRIDILVKNGITGLILVFVVLLIFLDLRLSIWITAGIPISFAVAMIVLVMIGQSINMISLFALILALGLVVDDAIIIGENVHSHQLKNENRLSAAVSGASEMSWPVLAAIMTTITAFLPLQVIPGVFGKFIGVLPTTVIAVLIGSTIESLLILPAHLGHGVISEISPMRKKINARISLIINNYYAPVFHFSLRHKSLVVSICVATLIFSFGMIKSGHLKSVVFPKMDSDAVIATVYYPEGTPSHITSEGVEQIEAAAIALNKTLKPKSEGETLQRIFASVGHITLAKLGVTPGPHVGEVFIEMMPTEIRGIHSNKIIAKWRDAVGNIAGAENITITSHNPGPGGAAIDIELTGDDAEQMILAANEVKLALGLYEGVYDIDISLRPGRRELNLRLKDSARHLGVTQNNLAKQLRQGYYGEDIFDIQRQRDEVSVVVRYPIAERRTLEQIKRIRIRTKTGLELPLQDVADIDLSAGSTTIHRMDGKKSLRITASVDEKRGNAEEVLKIMTSEKLPEILQNYPGVIPRFEGQKKEFADSLGALLYLYPIAILAIFAILSMVFHSYLQPLIIMTAIPFGLIGAVLGHIIMGLDLSMMSMFGLVALAGVVVNDSLVLIDVINSQLRNGATVKEAVMHSGPARFRAVIITTLTTVAGLMPLILEKSFQAQFLIPMAVSLAFGLMFATFVTLFLVPCLFLYLNTARRYFHYIRFGTMPTPEEVEEKIVAE